MKAVNSRERRIVALMCAVGALLNIIDIGQEIYTHQPVRYLKVFLAVGFLVLVAMNLHRARAGV